MRNYRYYTKCEENGITYYKRRVVHGSTCNRKWKKAVIKCYGTVTRYALFLINQSWNRVVEKIEKGEQNNE